jgi:RNA polymerase sigma-70 factor, ECF subfamily
MEGTQALQSMAMGQLAAARESTLGAFTDAVERHKSMVFSIGWHFLRDRGLAEELAQDVFLELHRNWSRMQSADHLLFWLRKVSSHRAIDLVRKRKSRPELSLEAASEPTTFEKMHDTMLRSYLERMVATLPEKQRMAIVLRYQEGLEPEEISKVLAMNVSTVKTNISRALDLLRAKTAGKLQRPQQANSKSGEQAV